MIRSNRQPVSKCKMTRLMKKSSSVEIDCSNTTVSREKIRFKSFRCWASLHNDRWRCSMARRFVTSLFLLSSRKYPAVKRRLPMMPTAPMTEDQLP